MSHSSAREPSKPPTVSENLNNGTLIVQFMSGDGEAQGYEIPLRDAERLATHLRDRASAIRTYLDMFKPPGSRHDLAY